MLRSCLVVRRPEWKEKKSESNSDENEGRSKGCTVRRPIIEFAPPETCAREKTGK